MLPVQGFAVSHCNEGASPQLSRQTPPSHFQWDTLARDLSGGKGLARLSFFLIFPLPRGAPGQLPSEALLDPTRHQREIDCACHSQLMSSTDCLIRLPIWASHLEASREGKKAFIPKGTVLSNGHTLAIVYQQEPHRHPLPTPAPRGFRPVTQQSQFSRGFAVRLQLLCTL